jgi:transposase
MKAQLLKRKKAELADEVIVLRGRNAELEHQLDLYKRMIFGQKRERFISETPEGQLLLDLGLEELVRDDEEVVEQVTVTKTKRKGKPVRRPLPESLPRKTTVIEPDVDLTGAVRIGEEVTEWLEVKPCEFYVRRIVRPKYAWPDKEERGIAIAELPSRPIHKSMAGASLLALIILDKYVDHLPLYRQVRRFGRLGVKISKSTMGDWIAGSCQLLEPLYAVLKALVLASSYLQADETTMRVLDRYKIDLKKKGKAHLGYQWIYQDPVRGLVLFDYQPGRDRSGPRDLLKDFIGYLQSDAYVVYDIFDTGLYPGIIALACWAHVRRYFERAKDNDPKRAEEALTLIRQLYKIEEDARERNLSHQDRKALRDEKAVPILERIKTWLGDNLTATTPKSPIGVAIAYALKRWDKMTVYTLDGRLEIDNNLAENSVRPIALGRKNYLFAGSHAGAERAAMLYSFMATCKRQGVNPNHWLVDVLDRIKEHPVNKLEELLPGNWKPLKQDYHAEF